MPLHFWLADANVVALMPICVLLAGAMSELGLYGIGRVWFASFADAFGQHGADVGLVLIVCGAATALLGGVMCLAQDHLKRMLAFATIAYVGIFLIGLGTLSEDGVAGAALFVVSEGADKAALFGAVGILQHRKADVSERGLRGAARDLPLVAVVFVLGALSFAAVPLSGAFAGKAMIEDVVTARGRRPWAIAAIVAALGFLFTATVLRAAARIFLGWPPAGAGDRGKPSPDEARGDEEAEGEAGEEDVDRDRTPLTSPPTVLLVIAPVVLGVVPGVADRFLDAAAAFVAGPGYHDAVLESAGAAGAPAFVAHASALWIAAVTTVAAIAVAALALASERRGGGILPRTGRLAESAVSPRRAIHTGHAGDYVAWSGLGMAAVGGARRSPRGFPA